MSDSKILLTYKDDEDNFHIESVWTTKEGNYYRIKNIPFFAPNIALDDLVSVNEEDGVLYFEELIEPSGHSTIQMVLFESENVNIIGKQLEEGGCTWEGSHVPTIISIDIPKEVDYVPIKAVLEQYNDSLWSYKEACLAHSII